MPDRPGGLSYLNRATGVRRETVRIENQPSRTVALKFATPAV